MLYPDSLFKEVVNDRMHVSMEVIDIKDMAEEDIQSLVDTGRWASVALARRASIYAFHAKLNELRHTDYNPFYYCVKLRVIRDIAQDLGLEEDIKCAIEEGKEYARLTYEGKLVGL